MPFKMTLLCGMGFLVLCVADQHGCLPDTYAECNENLCCDTTVSEAMRNLVQTSCKTTCCNQRCNRNVGNPSIKSLNNDVIISGEAVCFTTSHNGFNQTCVGDIMRKVQEAENRCDEKINNLLGKVEEKLEENVKKLNQTNKELDELKGIFNNRHPPTLSPSSFPTGAPRTPFPTASPTTPKPSVSPTPKPSSVPTKSPTPGWQRMLKDAYYDGLPAWHGFRPLVEGTFSIFKVVHKKGCVACAYGTNFNAWQCCAVNGHGPKNGLSWELRRNNQWLFEQHSWHQLPKNCKRVDSSPKTDIICTKNYKISKSDMLFPNWREASKSEGHGDNGGRVFFDLYVKK